jgi:hypothetical protein
VILEVAKIAVLLGIGKEKLATCESLLMGSGLAVYEHMQTLSLQ